MTYQFKGVSTVTRPSRLFLRIKKSVSVSLVSYLSHRWEGKLAGFSDGIVTLEPSAGKIVRFSLTQVEKANLKFEW